MGSGEQQRTGSFRSSVNHPSSGSYASHLLPPSSTSPSTRPPLVPSLRPLVPLRPSSLEVGGGAEEIGCRPKNGNEQAVSHGIDDPEFRLLSRCQRLPPEPPGMALMVLHSLCPLDSSETRPTHLGQSANPHPDTAVIADPLSC